MEAIRNCPFCEGEALKRMTGNNSVTFRYAYQCAECLAMTGWYWTDEEAADAWNRLAYDAEIERLEEIAWQYWDTVLELDGVKRELEAAVADLALIKGQHAPCRICTFADMIGCVHKDHCGFMNRCFRWRGDKENGKDGRDEV